MINLSRFWFRTLVEGRNVGVAGLQARQVKMQQLKFSGDNFIF